MSQNIRPVPGASAVATGRIWKVDGSGLASMSALVDPGEALDGRAVEADALGEGLLELGRGDRHGFQEAEHVGEPQPDESDVPLFQGPKHELLLPIHFGHHAPRFQPAH